MYASSTLQSTSIQLITRAGDEVTLSVLAVPTIATPLKISHLVYQTVERFPCLQGLDMSHPIIHSSDFEITVLIGADFYWKVVGDKIIHGNGPTVVQSKLGYLLSGPIPLPDGTGDIFHAVVQLTDDSSTVSKFWEVESSGTLSSQETPTTTNFSLVHISNLLSDVEQMNPVLKDYFKLFDPLRFVSQLQCPLSTLQELWQHKLDWDEPLPDELKTC